ncbi:glycosyltransferase [Paenibacillus sp. LHD-38]|uniref:glycosyltransferase n=1 Tax=Paenibacillus sp. LHD-38 TaxID=3072143 RepID=UPI00280F964D|nr:glycosyltransferase [Paenibacillus sp. LHD-38]MDQ8735754.1 glycosyltransferase [Paenibacillus sp. LHD-38]
MKKVLFISYLFPPIGASQRALKFAKFLPQFGWSPIILTPEKSNYPKVDKTMLNEIPKECEVFRLKSCEKLPGNPYITINDFLQGWFPATIMEGVRLIEEKKIDAIYSVSAPYVSLLSGLALKRLTGKPLVIDLRDEWTTNPFIQRSRYKKDIGFNKKLEIQVLKESDAVITVSDSIKDTLFKLSGTKSKKKFHTIMNGYDSEDFNNITLTTQNNDKFKICYMGSIYGHIKILADRFFKDFEKSLREKKIRSNKVEIRLVGYLDNIRFPDNWKLNSLIKRTGYVNHNSALKMAASSDLLLLLIDPKQGDQTVTSKIFELINLRKPILAIVPPNGAAAKIIRETRTGIVIDSNRPWEAIRIIETYIRSWEQGVLRINPDMHAIENYDRRRLTERLAAILNNVTK